MKNWKYSSAISATYLLCRLLDLATLRPILPVQRITWSIWITWIKCYLSTKYTSTCGTYLNINNYRSACWSKSKPACGCMIWLHCCVLLVCACRILVQYLNNRLLVHLPQEHTVWICALWFHVQLYPTWELFVIILFRIFSNWLPFVYLFSKARNL